MRDKLKYLLLLLLSVLCLSVLGAAARTTALRRRKLPWILYLLPWTEP